MPVSCSKHAVTWRRALITGAEHFLVKACTASTCIYPYATRSRPAHSPSLCPASLRTDPNLTLTVRYHRRS